MRPRSAAALAWSSVVFAALLAAISVALVARSGSSTGVFDLEGATDSAGAQLVAGLVLLAIPIVGAVIVSRRPDHPLGWLFCGLGVVLANDPMTGPKEALIRDLASQAGPVLRNVRLVEELRESRRRIVTAQDERARKLERDLHDRAQQQLVALGVRLKLARQAIDRDRATAAEMLDAVQGLASDALEELRDLARGIYPPLLADRGLPTALEAQARKSGLPVRVAPNGVGRYSQEVEAAVYFCTLEALNNVSKYANATHVEVRPAQDGDELVFEIRDDGVGFDPAIAARGTGLQGMADRPHAIGGRLDVCSAMGSGTMVRGRVRARGAS